MPLTYFCKLVQYRRLSFNITEKLFHITKKIQSWHQGITETTLPSRAAASPTPTPTGAGEAQELRREAVLVFTTAAFDARFRPSRRLAFMRVLLRRLLLVVVHPCHGKKIPSSRY